MKLILCALVTCAFMCDSRLFCGRIKLPLEVGSWRHDFKHLDAAVVQNEPVSISQGQIYVYENYFPGHIIKYIHVDNVARKTCGASASIRTGGVGTSSVLIVLQSEPNQEIRSVVDVWGTKDFSATKPQHYPAHLKTKNIKSLYLSNNVRAINHNTGY